MRAWSGRWCVTLAAAVGITACSAGRQREGEPDPVAGEPGAGTVLGATAACTPCAGSDPDHDSWKLGILLEFNACRWCDLRCFGAWRVLGNGAAGRDLSDSNLRCAALGNLDLRSANLRRVDLSSANLSGANLSDAKLESADLSGATLVGADLSGAWLFEANLVGADLSGATLVGARIVSADLSGANLSNANLTGAFLDSSNLSDANLSGANLTSARWTDARRFCAAGSIGECKVGPPPAPIPVLPPTFTNVQTSILTPTCATIGCHDPLQRSGQLVLSSGSGHAAIVNVASVEDPTLKRVAPNASASSYLYRKILGVGITGDRMPLQRPPLGEGQLHLIRDWIDRGAPND